MTREELREEIAPLFGELVKIRKLLEGEDAPAPSTACMHPESRRQNLTAADGIEEWICGVPGCLFHFRAEG